MTKIDEYLYYTDGRYMIQLGYRLQSKDKEHIMKIYQQCKQANFKPSKVTRILSEHTRYKRNPLEYRVQDFNNGSQALYIQGWYVLTAKPELINERLQSYLQAEDKLEWLDTNIILRHKERSTDERYIYRITNTGKYRVSKYNSLLAKQCYYGEYDTLEEAIRERDKQAKNGWKIPSRKRKPYKHQKHLYAIHKTPNGTFTIQKQGVHYGTYKTLEDAIEERDWLIENNWNYDNIDLY